ncbi:hypothetical protein [Muricoccus radiodurans]
MKTLPKEDLDWMVRGILAAHGVVPDNLDTLAPELAEQLRRCAG